MPDSTSDSTSSGRHTSGGSRSGLSPRRAGAGLRTRFRRRLMHHAIIGFSALIGGIAVTLAYDRPGLRHQVSLASAFVGFALIALSLVLGPLNLVLRRPNPVSNDLRRDLGLWGATVGLLHVAVGLTVHMQGRMYLYFLAPPESHSLSGLRLDAFGVSNYLGLFSGGVLVLLLFLSSDAALRRFGAARWKRWQRLNYFGVVALVGHGVLYQIADKRRSELVVLFAAIAVTVAGAQALGVRAFRRRH